MMNDATPGLTLVTLARNAIASRLGKSPTPVDVPPELSQRGASFVTLTRHGSLRGCIGTLEAWRPLIDDVQENACAAAFGDPRFPPLDEGEWADIDVEVSLLSPAEPLPARSESEACARLRPGIDGVILEAHGRRATFLPQVWEQLPDPHRFLGHLKQKAGLAADAWDSDFRLQRYTVQKWRAQ